MPFKNQEVKRAYMKAYHKVHYALHRERYLEKTRVWKVANIQRSRQYQRDWRQKKYQENAEFREKFKTEMNAKYHADPLVRKGALKRAGAAYSELKLLKSLGAKDRESIKFQGVIA